MAVRSMPTVRAVLVTALVSACAAPRVWGQISSPVINVRDFGAAGDGQADDTVAIRAALDAAQAQHVSLTTPWGVYYNTSPVVLFPPGRYKVTQTLPVSTTVIRGEGYASIEMADRTKDILYGDWAWRMTIEGLTLIGGRAQVSLGNPNIDTGFLVVRDCKFYFSGGPAVEFREGSNSTHAIVQDCEFIECAQALINYCDQLSVARLWITSSREMANQAVIEARGGRCSFSDLLLVPLVNGKDQRWIDNYAHVLACVHCRFGGEGGGFTPVVNFTKFRTDEVPTQILLQDCNVCAQGNNKRKCAIYCEEVPNAIALRDCALQGVPAVLVDERLDLRTYFKGAQPGTLSYVLDGNVGQFMGELPELLRRPVLLPAEPEGMLSAEETKRRLAGILRREASRPSEDDLPGESQGHKQQTDPAKFRDLTPPQAQWDLNDLMDATAEPNSVYIAMGLVGDDVVLMRRTGGRWPHVLIRDVTLDLDETPWLTWRQKPTARGRLYWTAVRVLDKQSGTMLLIDESEGTADYKAYNLKQLFGLPGGKRTFDIKFYFLEGYKAPADAGDYMVVDFLRAEAE
jgi:hypothetical protein